jgi:hypothetical protein
MSYALDFAPDAYSQWRELEAELQELALDEADRVADNPPPPPVQEMVRDVVRRGTVLDDYIFVRLVLDRQRRLVVVTGVTPSRGRRAERGREQATA